MKNFDFKHMILTALIFIVIWNVLEFLLAVVIMHNSFVFAPSSIAMPVFIAVVCEVLETVMFKKNR